MNLRRTLLQALILVVMASAIAIVANGFASRTRRLVLPGFYPNALKVPPRQPEAPAVPPAPVTTATVAPVTETIVTETVATIEPAATTTTPGAVTPVAPQKIPNPAPAPQVDPLARFQPHPDKAAVEISGEDAALLYSRGVLFLDARRTAAFEESHIAGARPFSVWEADIDDKVSALFDERPDPAQQNQPIVIYCTGGACEDSHMLAQKLWGIQFNNVYVYKDGFPDWQKRGGAVRSGPKP
jgi:rhodanese-related sulfurtransferase